MPQDKANSGTPHLSTDDLLNDYLSDMFSGVAVPEQKVSDQSTSLSSQSEHEASKPIYSGALSEDSEAFPNANMLTTEAQPVEQVSEQIQPVELQSLESSLVEKQAFEIPPFEKETFDLQKGETANGERSTVAVIQAELSQESSVIDVFGSGHVDTIEAIAPRLSLIPTIKLIRSEEDKGYRTQTEAQIILLVFLFYLRRPLTPRVRRSFLDFSEQAIDDYYAAVWLAQAHNESLK